MTGDWRIHDLLRPRKGTRVLHSKPTGDKSQRIPAGPQSVWPRCRAVSVHPKDPPRLCFHGYLNVKHSTPSALRLHCSDVAFRWSDSNRLVLSFFSVLDLRLPLHSSAHLVVRPPRRPNEASLAHPPLSMHTYTWHCGKTPQTGPVLGEIRDTCLFLQTLFELMSLARARRRPRGDG